MIKCTAINREDLNNYLEKRGVKEKIWYYWFKYFDKKLNKRTLISLFKKISYEILNKKGKINIDILRKIRTGKLFCLLEHLSEETLECGFKNLNFLE